MYQKTKSADPEKPAELLHHLARAAQANIVAHKIIFWKDMLNTTEKATARPAVEKWIQEIKVLVNQLKGVDQDLCRSGTPPAPMGNCECRGQRVPELRQ